MIDLQIVPSLTCIQANPREETNVQIDLKTFAQEDLS
jgi:hypothetical protein